MTLQNEPQWDRKKTSRRDRGGVCDSNGVIREITVTLAADPYQWMGISVRAWLKRPLFDLSLQSGQSLVDCASSLMTKWVSGETQRERGRGKIELIVRVAPGQNTEAHCQILYKHTHICHRENYTHSPTHNVMSSMWLDGRFQFRRWNWRTGLQNCMMLLCFCIYWFAISKSGQSVFQTNLQIRNIQRIL